MTEFVLTLSCPDRPGIVAAVSGLLAGRGGNITESQQFGDRDTGRFFMRVQFTVDPAGSAARPGPRVPPGPPAQAAGRRDGGRAGRTGAGVQPGLGAVRHRGTAARPDPRVAGRALPERPAVPAAVGQLGIDIAAVASNHPDLRPLTQTHGIDYHHLPVRPETRAAQENEILTLVEHYRADFVVLARYMQVLTDAFCGKLPGRIINIHHSFLPSFKGSRPYHQAHARGVKLIGATAHYVTTDLDEGPIIEQEVARVDHADSPAELMAIGRDTECIALARAVRWHADHRVLLNGDKTVVFR